MNLKEKALEAARGLGEFSIPELQYVLNVDYETAKRLVDDLVNRGNLTFLKGITFRFVENERPQRPFSPFGAAFVDSKKKEINEKRKKIMNKPSPDGVDNLDWIKKLIFDIENDIPDEDDDDDDDEEVKEENKRLSHFSFAEFMAERNERMAREKAEKEASGNSDKNDDDDDSDYDEDDDSDYDEDDDSDYDEDDDSDYDEDDDEDEDEDDDLDLSWLDDEDDGEMEVVDSPSGSSNDGSDDYSDDDNDSIIDDLRKAEEEIIKRSDNDNDSLLLGRDRSKNLLDINDNRNVDDDSKIITYSAEHNRRRAAPLLKALKKELFVLYSNKMYNICPQESFNPIAFMMSIEDKWYFTDRGASIHELEKRLDIGDDKVSNRINILLNRYKCILVDGEIVMTAPIEEKTAYSSLLRFVELTNQIKEMEHTDYFALVSEEMKERIKEALRNLVIFNSSLSRELLIAKGKENIAEEQNMTSPDRIKIFSLEAAVDFLEKSTDEQFIAFKKNIISI